MAAVWNCVNIRNRRITRPKKYMAVSVNHKIISCMSREILLTVFFLGLQFSLVSKIPAQNRKGQIFYSKDDGLYWAAIETSYFKEYVASQRNNNWCWAACTQMVLNYQGVNVTQEQIVERVFGVQVDRPGTAQNIVEGARGWYVDGHTIGAKSDNSFIPQKLIDDLVNKYPLVVGLSMPGQNVGHAYVLTGISFQKNVESIYPQSVILRDPWPDNPSRLVLSWSEFKRRCHTIVHIYPEY